jgi:hypothetical protein
MWRLGKNEVFTGGMGSYSTICLAISFLQVSFCFNIHVTSLIANSRTQQHPKIRNNEIDPMKNLGILLIEFFELYGLVFNWEDLGISIREGGSYFDKRDRNWYKSGYQPNFAIEDPQDQRKFAFRRNQSEVTLTEPATSERHLEGNLRNSFHLGKFQDCVRDLAREYRNASGRAKKLSSFNPDGFSKRLASELVG